MSREWPEVDKLGIEPGLVRLIKKYINENYMERVDLLMDSQPQSVRNRYFQWRNSNVFQPSSPSSPYNQTSPHNASGNLRHSFLVPGMLVEWIARNKFRVEPCNDVTVSFPTRVSEQPIEVTVSGKSWNSIVKASLECWQYATQFFVYTDTIYDRQIVNSISRWDKKELLTFSLEHLVYIHAFNSIATIRGYFLNNLVNVKIEIHKKFGTERIHQSTLSGVTTIINDIHVTHIKDPPRPLRPPTTEQPRFLRPIDVLPKSSTSGGKLKKETNILLLGCSGVGKSTFVNALANYLHFGTNTSQAETNLKVLIKAKFSMCDENGTEHHVVLEPEDKNDTANEALGVGTSATQEPRCHSFVFDDDKIIRIIDTPGLLDTGGAINDQMHMKNIIKFIRHFKTIQAIFILSKPDETRLSPPFRFYLNELLSRLHCDAARNIIFAFPRCGNYHFNVGDTRRILNKLLEGINKRHGVELKLNTDNTFCFDSEGFKYFATMKFASSFRKGEEKKDKAIKYWTKSAENTKRILEYVATLPDYEVKKTLDIQNAKNIIEILAKPMGDMTRSHLENQATFRAKREEIEKLKREERSDLDKNLYVMQKRFIRQRLDNPLLVCQKCTAGMVKPDGSVKVCHDNCHCLGSVMVGSNPNVNSCEVFVRFGENRCSICGCPWTAYTRITSNIVCIEEKVMDETVKQGRFDKQELLKKAENFCNKLEEENIKMTRTLKLLQESAAIFAIFVEQNSLVACNDAYNEYIQMCMHETTDQSSRAELKKFQEQYKQELSVHKGVSSNQRKISLEELQNKLYELKNNSDIGKFIEGFEEFLDLSNDSRVESKLQKIKELFGGT